jgi:cell division septation protein DedD
MMGVGLRRCYVIAVGLIALSCAACSNEIDRRDELGIDREGRSELVPLKSELESEKESEATAAVEAENRTILVREEAQPSEEMPAESPQRTAVKQKEQLEDAQLIHYDPQGGFTVQVAGYRDKKKAQALVQELSQSGYPAYEIARSDGGEMRVRIGYFKTGEEAEAFGRRFQADRKMEYWVDKRENE